MAEGAGCRCHFFFLYDGSKVKGEGDPTSKGICYFYPEETSTDNQELLCGQLAGVGRCVSEISASPVRVLRLRRHKFAIHTRDDFFWALGCSPETPTTSVCQLLDTLINLFCFYNGSVRQSYQLQSQETLATRWSRYLLHVLAGPSELHLVFTSLSTIDSTNVDPLLLLKAALILQSCQRCPLVLAGCILFRGRVVSTQMSPALTMKVMVHESENFKAQSPKGPSTPCYFDDAVSSKSVFLTAFELQYLQSAPVEREWSQTTPTKDPPLRHNLSRTPSDSTSTESAPSDPSSSPKVSFSPRSSTNPCPSSPNGATSHGTEREAPPNSNADISNRDGVERGRSDSSSGVEGKNIDANRGGTDFRNEESQDHTRGKDKTVPVYADDNLLVPMTLYLHRVKGLVLALLVEPHFLRDQAAMEEVYHSCLASLNGLEAHLRSVPPGTPAAARPYTFAHYDREQGTLTTNLSARAGRPPEPPFVTAASLLHSHFCNTETLQEAIIRNASAAVYGVRSVAQETYFAQHGAALVNSGVPDHRDSAFSLPAKARHRLLKHGVNLL
ncbi:BLOC-3 complex member HPS4 isoform X2 [Stigmatopora argus]